MSDKNIMDQFKLDGKVAIVTGSSRGLGQGMAIGMAEAGADIACVDINNMDETVEKVEELGQNAIQIKADLSSKEPIDEIIERTDQELGRIDILLNNAGIIRRDPVTEFSEEDWDDVMDINIRTVFFLSQSVANYLIDQGEGGSIINIASMLSFEGGIKVPSYTASKSAVNGLTKEMANELAEYDINVNAIAPGYMATANTAPLRKDPERSKAIADRIPVGRWGKPEDLKGAAVFLASDASNYMQGYTVAVDGGWLAR